MSNGKFLAEDDSIPAGQDIVAELLNRCLKWAEIVLTRFDSLTVNSMRTIRLIVAPRQGKIDERFRGTYDRLYEIRNQLERLSLTQAWSLRETDLYNYQRRLDRVDESRIHGNFEDSQGNKADIHTQRVRKFLVVNKPDCLC